MLLLSDGAARGASPDAAPLQEITKLNQRRDRDLRVAKRHAGAGTLVQHPRRDRQHLTGADLHVNDVAAGAPLHVLATEPPPVEGVPSIANLDDLPDMCQRRSKFPQKRRSKNPQFRRSGHLGGVAVLRRSAAPAGWRRLQWGGDDRLCPRHPRR